MIHSIASFAKPQPDTILAIFLLRRFGETKFPGASTAKLEFWVHLPEGETTESLEEKGYLLIDLGHGRFDHHITMEDGKPAQCASEIVAEALGVTTDPALKKLLAYARRDDLEGKGTISPDPLDRAFGLSGLISNLNRAFAHDLAGVVSMVMAMFEAHYQEEENRTKVMPAEWKQLQEDGAVQTWTIQSTDGLLRVVQVPTDNPGMAGYLRAFHHYDLVLVRRSTGHVNIISNQSNRMNLAPVAAHLRIKEAERAGRTLPPDSDLLQPGRLPEAPEWYYDTMANTLQNGGIRPELVTPTSLSDTEIMQALRNGLQIQS